MIKDSLDLLEYISENKSLNLSENTPNSLGINSDTLNSYLNELELKGYIKRYFRSYGITPRGSEFLNE